MINVGSVVTFSRPMSFWADSVVGSEEKLPWLPADSHCIILRFTRWIEGEAGELAEALSPIGVGFVNCGDLKYAREVVSLKKG